MTPDPQARETRDRACERIIVRLEAAVESGRIGTYELLLQDLAAQVLRLRALVPGVSLAGPVTRVINKVNQQCCKPQGWPNIPQP